MNELNVLYSTDSNYAAHAAASIQSLLNHNQGFEKITIYILDDGISDLAKKQLFETVAPFSQASLHFIPQKDLLSRLNLNKDNNYALAGYGRLMVSNVVPADKVLYLDCDTIVSDSVKSLWNTDITDYYVAGVQDNPALYNVTAIGMTASDQYINGGVLLINLKKWREDDLEDRFIRMITEHGGFVRHHDQGIINGVCKGNILILHPRYNTMSQFYLMSAKQIQMLFSPARYYTQKELDEATNAPTIIHYISKFYNRPWCKDCTHPKKDLYLEALSQTPFDVCFTGRPLSRKVKLRKLAFYCLPFSWYCAIERMLDKKRQNYLTNT